MASGGKTNFSRIVGLASQTLLVDCFCKCMEVSPSVFIHNLSHLKGTVVGEAEAEKRGLPGSLKEPSGLLGFPIALTVCLIYSHCLCLSISQSREPTAATLKTSRCKSSAIRGHFLQKQNGPHPPVPQSIASVVAAFAWQSGGIPPALRFSPFSGSFTLVTAT